MKVWSIILAGVVAAEHYSKRTGCPTPSCVAGDHPIITGALGGYVLFHLLRALPDRYDLLRRLA